MKILDAVRGMQSAMHSSKEAKVMLMTQAICQGSQRKI